MHPNKTDKGFGFNLFTKCIGVFHVSPFLISHPNRFRSADLGDSILGYKSHMGAGSLTSNVKSDKTLVVVKSADEQIPTGLKKFGAMLGDFVEVGCNSVLNPGTVIGPHTNIYPTSCVRGVVPANSIWKTGGKVVPKTL